MSGEWHFSYGADAQTGAMTLLAPGGFYTEPAGIAHYAFTGDQPAVVYITGQGPSDTHYVTVPDASGK